MNFDPTTIETDLDYKDGTLRVIEGDEAIVYVLVERGSEKAHVINIVEK